MALHFRGPHEFGVEALWVTCAAAAAGAVATVGLAATSLPMPMTLVAGGAGLTGAAIAAAATRVRPMSKLMRGVLGLGGGVIAGGAFTLIAASSILGPLALVVAGALGGATLAGILGAEEKVRLPSHALGLSAATLTGAVAGPALARIADYAISERTPVILATTSMAAMLGLWVSAAAGLRRLERARHPILQAVDELLVGLVEPVRKKVIDARDTWVEIGHGITADPSMSPEMADEARKQADRLLESVVETTRTWRQIHHDVSSPRLVGLKDKLADLETRASNSTDDVTRGHLLRAVQALQAQKSAIDGLTVGKERAEAALDAHVALLERLRLAVAQHRVSDRERFAVEVSAVGDQVARLSEDLESLSAAIAEAEALSDKRALAELERAGRRALSALDPGVDSTAADTSVVEPAEAGSVRAPRF